MDLTVPALRRPLRGMDAERAAVARRQAQFNRHYPGVPLAQPTQLPRRRANNDAS